MRTLLLSEMLTELRNEARISTSPAHGAHLLERQISLLRRTQEAVYDGYDWPNLDTDQTITLPSGQRYAAYPDAFVFAGVRRVYARVAGGKYELLEYGISVTEMNAKDSDAGVTAERPTRFSNYLSPLAETPNANMFEVWPVPAAETQLRFEGQLRLQPLTDAALHRSTVDGMVIVLHAAAELLAGQNAEDATLKIKKAQDRYDSLKMRESAPDNRRVFLSAGGGSQRRTAQRFRHLPE